MWSKSFPSYGGWGGREAFSVEGFTQHVSMSMHNLFSKGRWEGSGCCRSLVVIKRTGMAETIILMGGKSGKRARGRIVQKAVTSESSC